MLDLGCNFKAFIHCTVQFYVFFIKLTVSSPSASRKITSSSVDNCYFEGFIKKFTAFLLKMTAFVKDLLAPNFFYDPHKNCLVSQLKAINWNGVYEQL